jgi:translin
MQRASTRCCSVVRSSVTRPIAIRAVHRSEFDTAAELIERAQDKTAEVNRLLGDFPEIYHSGFVSDAQKELAEASLTLALVRADPLPSPAALHMAEAPYLNGLGEAVGELRRHVLDVLRTGAVEESERHLQAMDDIYAVLVTVDFPDAITGGLRRTTDVTRGILEKTRADLTLAAQQYALERRINAFERRLGSELSIEAKAGQP